MHPGRPIGAPPPRDRVLDAALALLVENGREAVSTRAITAASGVQAPALYRLFGDKQGLLDALALRGFEDYLADADLLEGGGDPVDELRRGFDAHVAFGLANPYLYSLAYGDARPGYSSPAAAAADRVLAALVRRVAATGRLRVPEERAVDMLHAAGCGTTLTLIATPADRRDPEMIRASRDGVIAFLTTAAPPGSDGLVAAAVHLRAALDGTTALTDGERTLLHEWLERLAAEGR